MSRSVRQSSSAAAGSPLAKTAWILTSWKDLLLFVATPVLIFPLVMVLHSRLFTAQAIGTFVAAVGATGHQLPGMMRAYGDPQLFRRFRGRFIIAPLFLMLVCLPLAFNNLSGMLAILLIWGFWHGMMQVYGFVRIYDVKAGSTDSVTAWLDWLMCLTWFTTCLVHSDARMPHLLNIWYSGGGPLIPVSYIEAFRSACIAVTAVVTFCFLANHGRKLLRGQPVNPNKFLMLGSGIGFWWICTVYVKNVVLGIAMFEVFHDVQYLAIVWLYNRARVDRATEMSSFMKFMFRRSWALLLLYLGLVVGYGLALLYAKGVPSDGVQKTALALAWSLAILHFYYDGFIWKVREKTLREGLGLAGGKAEAGVSRWFNGELLHALKWTPFVVIVVWMATTELTHSYPPPEGGQKRVWDGERQLLRTENISQVAPGDAETRGRLAMMLDNVGRTDESIQLLQELLEREPSFASGHLTLGRIHQRLGRLPEAEAAYDRAIEAGEQLPRDWSAELTEANFLLGNLHYQRQEYAAAADRYRQALKHGPDFEAARQGLRAAQR